MIKRNVRVISKYSQYQQAKKELFKEKHEARIEKARQKYEVLQ